MMAALPGSRTQAAVGSVPDLANAGAGRRMTGWSAVGWKATNCGLAAQGAPILLDGREA